MTGGGSGGHITPILAVARELKRLNPDTHTVYVGQKGDNLADIPATNDYIDNVYSVRAGKFRRYHGEGLRQLLDIKTIFLNFRDVLNVLAGIFQSYKLLRQLKPDVIFIKGGFVGVPVGLAAARLKIPFVTHDSDAIPGLANRLISRWAALHAVALPTKVYPYNPDRTVSVGIPLVDDFKTVTPEIRATYRQEVGLPETCKALFIVGGGLGAQRINAAVGDILPHLLAEYPDLYVIHGVGRSNEAVMTKLYDENLPKSSRRRVTVKGYLTDLYRYSGAADVVVTRAGATNLAEFSVQGKACVVIPSPFLTGGHQLKNAKFLADSGVAVVVDERDMQADANYLARAISDLLKNPKAANEMASRFAASAQKNSASTLAKILVEQAHK